LVGLGRTSEDDAVGGTLPVPRAALVEVVFMRLGREERGIVEDEIKRNEGAMRHALVG
jgi:hypothetical protein